MTEEELQLKTLKYRGPTIIPLDDGRLGLWFPGQDPEYHIFDNFSALWAAVNYYTENNVLRPINPRPAVRKSTKATPSDLLAALGLGKET